jgi:2-keto-4-pentenoate hydratase
MTPIDEVARMLCDARRANVLLDGLPERLHVASVDDAHAVQVATAGLLGDAIGGWKVATAPDGRLARGGLLRSRIHRDGATIPAALVPLLGVEAEIAFRLERDVPARATPYSYDEVADAVTALPAIEIVDSRYRGYPATPFLDRLADFMSNGAFIHGAPLPGWRTLDLTTLDVELRFDERTVVRRVGGHPAGDPFLPALALANDLRATHGLHAGDLVTTGTYTGLHHARPGQRVEAVFHGVASVRVHFGERP